MPEIAKILLIGPMTPPIGGARVSFDQLVDDLSKRDDVQIRTLNIPPQRTLISGLLWTVYTFLRMICLVPTVDIVSLHATMRATYLLGPMTWFLCKAFRKRCVFRKFGGVFDQRFEELSPLQKRILAKTVLDMDMLLFQTKRMVAYFSKVAPGRVEWFPTNRPVGSDFDGCEVGTCREARRFVFVGHVKPRKGVREIIEASRQIERDVVVDVYGPLMDGLTADEFSGQKAVYRGVVPPEQVIDTLRQYDVLLLPTYHVGEGYPGVIMESYCAGLPVITTNWNAIPEIVDGTSGMLVNPRDVEGLRDAMLHLMDSQEEYERLRRGAKKKAQEFSSEVWTERFVESTLSLLKNRTSRTSQE